MSSWNILELHLRGGLFINEDGTGPPLSVKLHRLTSENSDCIFEKLVYLQLILSRLAFSLFCAFQQKNKTKVKKKNRRNKVERKFSNIQTAFDFFMNTCIKGPI